VTLGGKAHIEKAAATSGLQEGLARRFSKVQVRARQSYFMGAVQAIRFEAKDRFTGAADPRRDGDAAGI